MASVFIAHRLQHAEFAAERVLKLPRSQVRLAYTSMDLQGLDRGTEIFIVRVPRYVANQRQRDIRRELVDCAYAKGLTFKHVNLK